MFKVGNRYEVRTLVLDDSGYGQYKQFATITKIDGPLIELNGVEVINTHSPTFEGARDVEASQKYDKTLEVQFMDTAKG